MTSETSDFRRKVKFMTELEDSEKHSVAKSVSFKEQKSRKSESKKSDSDLSNYSFELTAKEIAEIKRDYDRNPDRIAEDFLFKNLALEEMKNRQQIDRKMDNLDFEK